MRYFFNEEFFANGDIVAERVSHEVFPHAMRFHSIYDTGPYGYTVTLNYVDGKYTAVTAGCSRGVKTIEATGASIDDALVAYISLWKQA